MIDANGIEIKLGDKIVDNVGREGVMVNMSGTRAIKFTHEGKVHYSFEHKLISSQLRIVEVG